MNAPAGLEGADIKARVDAAVDSGMCMAVWAELQPDKMAVLEVSGRSRTFGELNANANRLVKMMRAHGLEAGDAVAKLLMLGREDVAIDGEPAVI